MKKVICPILILLAAVLFFSSFAAPSQDADLIRLHVIANSDSEEDISLKMKVVEEIEKLLLQDDVSSLSLIGTVEEKLDEIVERANRILSENGAVYTAAAEIGYSHFEKQSIGSSALPEGDYRALTVTLGEGRGHNWWSVIFPDISLKSCLAMGEDGRFGKTVLLGGKTALKMRFLTVDIIMSIKDSLIRKR